MATAKPVDQLLQEAAAAIPSNVPNGVLAQNLRNVVQDVIASYPNSTDDPSAPLEHEHVVADITDLAPLLDSKLDDTQLGAPLGAASLDDAGHLPDTQLPASVLSGLKYQGTWNGTTNLSPTIPQPTSVRSGQYWVASVAAPAGHVWPYVPPGAVPVGAWLMCDFANHPTFMVLVPNGQGVTTVAGRSGNVVLAAADIADTTADGRSLMTTPSQAASRTTLGLGTSSTHNVPVAGPAAAAEVVLGNDARLSNARTPLAHQHPVSDVTGLQADLDAKASTTDLTNGLALKEDLARRGALNGYAPLDANALVPPANLPPVDPTKVVTGIKPATGGADKTGSVSLTYTDIGGLTGVLAGKADAAATTSALAAKLDRVTDANVLNGFARLEAAPPGVLTAPLLWLPSNVVSNAPTWAKVEVWVTQRALDPTKDSGKTIFYATGSNVNVTLPNACPAGFMISFVNTGIGQLTFAVESGGTLVSVGGKNKLSTQYEGATLICYSKTGTNSVNANWYLK